MEKIYWPLAEEEDEHYVQGAISAIEGLVTQVYQNKLNRNNIRWNRSCKIFVFRRFARVEFSKELKKPSKRERSESLAINDDSSEAKRIKIETQNEEEIVQPGEVINIAKSEPKQIIKQFEENTKAITEGQHDALVIKITNSMEDLLTITDENARGKKRNIKIESTTDNIPKKKSRKNK